MRVKLTLTICLFHLVFPIITAAQELEIISPHWEGIRYEITEGFKEYRASRGEPAVTLHWIDVGGTSDILRFIHSEFKRSPNGIGIDLLFGGGIDPFLDLKEASLLAQTNEEALVGLNLNQLVAGNRLHDPDRYYQSSVISTFGILCNRTVLAARGLKPPITWSDLVKPEYHSWISIADPQRSGSSHLMFEIFLQGYGWQKGWEFIGKLAAQTPVILASSPQVGRDVVNGEAACGLQIDSHATAQLAEFGTDKLIFIVPTDLPVINGDGIALLKGAPHPEIAQQFIQYVLSPAGQRRIFLKKGVSGGPEHFEMSRFTIRPELYSEMAQSNVKLDPFSVKNFLNYNAAKGSDRWSIVNDIARVYLVERKQRLESVFVPPLKENEVEKLVQSKDWKVPEKRLATMAKWRNE